MFNQWPEDNLLFYRWKIHQWEHEKVFVRKVNKGACWKFDVFSSGMEAVRRVMSEVVVRPWEFQKQNFN